MGAQKSVALGKWYFCSLYIAQFLQECTDSFILYVISMKLFFFVNEVVYLYIV